MIKPSIIKAFLILFSIIAILNYVLYSSTLPTDIPRGDHWRWLKSALIPFLDGKKNFFEFITYEFYPLSHSHILTISNIWLNYSLFDLDYRIESYIGLISTLFATYLVCKHFLEKQHKSLSDTKSAVTLVLIIAIFLNTRNVNPWTLVQFEYLYILITIIFFLIVDAFLNQNIGKGKLVLASIFMFYLGDATGVAALVAVIGFLLLFHFKKHASTSALLIIIVISCIGLSHLILENMRPHTNISKLEALNYLLNHPAETLEVILIMSSQAIVEKHAIKHFIPNGGEIYQTIIGGIIFSFTLFAVYNFYRIDKIRRQAFPMLLILLCAVAMMGVILTRFPMAGIDAGHASRYVRLFQLGFIGALWINAIFTIEYIFNNRSHNVIKNTIKLISYSVAFFIIIGFFTHITFLWKYKPSVEKYFNNELNHIRLFAENNEHDLGPHILRCRNNFCDDSISFLQKNNLSLFKENGNKE